MDFTSLARTSGEWLRGAGPEADIVMSSRIRLARNLADFPFISRANAGDRAEIERVLHERIMAIDDLAPLTFVDVNKLQALDRQFLVERQLISREHAEAEGHRGVIIAENEQISLMINEEDHLRIQVIQSGLNLQNASITVAMW